MTKKQGFLREVKWTGFLLAEIGEKINVVPEDKFGN